MVLTHPPGLTGSTRPLRVISPVMATSDLTSRLLNSEARQVTMVTPADGPSLVTAPAGKWRWMSVPSRGSGLPDTVWGNGSSQSAPRIRNHCHSEPEAELKQLSLSYFAATPMYALIG